MLDEKLPHKLILFVALLAIWSLLVGLESEELLILGVPTCLLLALYLGGFILGVDYHKVLQPRRWLALARFLARYILIEIRTHLEVIGAIIDPRRISPAVVPIPYDLRSHFAITSLANSITNTPGTVSVWIDKGRRILYVHWLFARGDTVDEWREEVSRELEELWRGVFE